MASGKPVSFAGSMSRSGNCLSVGFSEKNPVSSSLDYSSLAAWNSEGVRGIYAGGRCLADI